MFDLFLKVSLLLIFITVIAGRANRLQSPNERPIIGILSQELSKSLTSVSNSASYIAASYVKWIEGQGARVVPIRINKSIDYYNLIFHSINGLLLPGGSASLRNSGYSKASEILYKLALEANNRGDFFPIWGTCLGFEQLLYFAAGERNYLTACDSNDRALPLTFQNGASSSRLFSKAPKKVMNILKKENSTSNFHRWCMTPENATKFGLDNFMTSLATSLDDNNLTFIASFEARNYPIWGVQFHPEKHIYEWGESYKSIPHSHNAVLVGQYFGSFFVDEARQNTHSFSTLENERQHLIYNYQPVYTGNASKSFLQTYFFD